MGCFLCWLTVHPHGDEGCSVRLRVPSVECESRQGRNNSRSCLFFFLPAEAAIVRCTNHNVPRCEPASQSFLPLRLRFRKETPPKATTLEMLEIV